MPARLPAALAAALVLGCAQSGSGPGAATASAPPAAHGDGTPGALYSMFHRSLPLPAGHAEILRLRGHGTQIFRCETQGGEAHWVYRLPQAELDGADGKVAVRHGVNLSFEHIDGSRLIGEIVDHVPAPSDGALPWLLIATRSFGDGALAGVTDVQRINTVGGMPPVHCAVAQIGQVLRVPFTADFVFFR